MHSATSVLRVIRAGANRSVHRATGPSEELPLPQFTDGHEQPLPRFGDGPGAPGLRPLSNGHGDLHLKTVSRCAPPCDRDEPGCPAYCGKFSGPCRAFADRLFSNTFRPKRTELTGFRRAAPRDNFFPEPAMRPPRECFASWLPFLARLSQENLP